MTSGSEPFNCFAITRLSQDTVDLGFELWDVEVFLS
jgi:hypothetical protein